MYVRRFGIPVHEAAPTRPRQRWNSDDEEATVRRTFADEPTIPDSRFYSDDPTDRFYLPPVKDR